MILLSYHLIFSLCAISWDPIKLIIVTEKIFALPDNKLTYMNIFNNSVFILTNVNLRKHTAIYILVLHISWFLANGLWARKRLKLVLGLLQLHSWKLTERTKSVVFLSYLLLWDWDSSSSHTSMVSIFVAVGQSLKSAT